MSWPLVKIGDVCTLMTGGTPKTSEPKFYEDGTIPWLVSGDIHKGEIFECEKRITEYAVENSNARYLPKDSVLIALNGQGKTRGTVALLRLKNATCNQSIVSINPKSKHDLFSDYLFYYLKSQYQNIRNITGDKDRAGLNMPLIRNIEIPLPPLTEQKRIAAILDKADAIRRKRQQAIQLADEFLRSVFLDMFGDPVTNPKGWEVKPLKELSLKIASGSTPKGGSKVYVDNGITFFRSQNVWKNDIRLDDVAFIDDKTHESLKKSSLKHKDILMTKTGRFNTENSSLGRAALFLGKDDSANVNGHVYLIRLKKNILHEFVVCILTSNEYRDHIRNVCVGGIDKRQLNKEHIEDFPIICPPHDLQLKFIENLRKIHKVRSNFTKGMKDVAPLFNALSQKAFAGKL